MRAELLRFFQSVTVSLLIVSSLWIIYMLIDEEPFNYGIATIAGILLFFYLWMRVTLRRMKTPFDRE